MKKNIYSILATDLENGFGKNNSLPWKISKDMEFFKNITSRTEDEEKQNGLIMGRKTWESIPKKFRPLPGRLNCVLTSNETYIDSENVKYFSNLDDAITFLNKNNKIEDIFIIGGASLYNSILDNINLKNIYLTKIEGLFDCDVFFYGIPETFELLEKSDFFEEKGLEFSFESWGRKTD